MALSETEKQELQQLKSMVAQAQQQQQTQNPPDQPQSMVGKVWDKMQVPAQMSKQGLQQMSDLQTDAQNAIAQKTGLPIGTEPTGNMVRDVVAGAPKVMADTMAEVAPKFIDRASLATMGAGAALKTAGKAVGTVLDAAPGITKPLENLAGLRPGDYVDAFKNPGTIADFGAKLKASELYNAIKDGSNLPAKLRTNAGLVKDAMDEISQGNILDARDAFKARKAVKALLSSKDSATSFPKDDLHAIKDSLDNMIFSSVKKADQIYKNAIQGERLRSPVPLNNNGTSSKVGAGIMKMMPMWLKPVFSPLAMGSTMSGLGAASQISPEAIVNAGGKVGMIDDAFSRLRKRKGS